MSDPGLTEEEYVADPSVATIKVTVPDGYTIDPFKQLAALQDIVNERLRQERLKVLGKFLYTCADTGITDLGRLCVLAEEFGEVAKEVNEGSDPELLKAELIQVAAVCVAWAETL